MNRTALTKAMAISAFLGVAAAAEPKIENPESGAIRNALYLHPMSLIISTAVKEFPLFAQLTYERNYAPHNSMIFTGRFIHWAPDDPTFDVGINGFSAQGGLRR